MTQLIDGIYLDQEEKEFFESFDKGLESGKVQFHTEEERKEINRVWQERINYAKEKAPITLRLQKRDISAMKVEAAKRGMPYQTLLASVVHQYVRGDLVERK